MRKNEPVGTKLKQTVLKDYTIVVARRGINDEGKGKKHALRRLVAEARTEYVHLMDDDVLPPAALPDTQADMVILPLRMKSDSPHPALLERLQIAEYAALQSITMMTAAKGRAVMCSGANLLVRRQRWMESYGDLHAEMASGDDMFLLESFKRRGLAIEVADRPEYEAVVRPVKGWRAFFRQRMRWAGKAAAFKDRDIRLCGMAVVVANVLQVVCPLVLAVKFPVEYKLVRKRDKDSPWWVILLLELLYPLYMLVSLTGGIASRQKKSASF